MRHLEVPGPVPREKAWSPSLDRYNLGCVWPLTRELPTLFPINSAGLEINLAHLNRPPPAEGR